MNKQFLANTALCVVLGGLVLIGVVNISSAVTTKGLMAKESEPSALMKELGDKVVLDKYLAGEEAGRIVKGNFYVTNHSDQDVKNLDVRCDFFGEKGNYLDQELWLLPAVTPAGKTKEYKTSSKRYIHTKAMAIRCKIVDLQLAKASFYTLQRSAAGEGHGTAAEGHGGDEDHGQPAH